MKILDFIPENLEVFEETVKKEKDGFSIEKSNFLRDFCLKKCK